MPRRSGCDATNHLHSDILDATNMCSVNGENVEVTQTFKYVGNVIHSLLAANQMSIDTWDEPEALDEGVWRC